MIVVVPADTADTTPEDDPIVATAGVPLDHVPPPGELDNARLPPVHTDKPDELPMGEGSGFTVTFCNTNVPVTK